MKQFVSGSWFEVRLRYEKVTDDGVTKSVTEIYVVNALSWTEAEAAVTKEFSSVNGFSILKIDKASYKEMIPDAEKEHFFKLRVAYLTVNEKTGVVKKTKVWYLVQDDKIEDARSSLLEAMSGTMADYEIASLSETKIFGII